MIKNILILLIFGLAIYLLSHFYKQSSMSLKEQSVLLTTKEGSEMLSYKKSSTKKESFSNVTIEKTTLTNGTEHAFYEVAQIDGLYEFNNDIEKIITLLFEAEEVHTHMSLNELKMMQLTLKDGRAVNLFVMDNDNKKIEFFYGLSSDQAMDILQKINKGITINLMLIKSDNLNESITEWSVLNNDFKGIISSIDY